MQMYSVSEPKKRLCFELHDQSEDDDNRFEVSKSTLSDVLVCGAFEQDSFLLLGLPSQQILDADSCVALKVLQ
jgi:hypothetical protein